MQWTNWLSIVFEIGIEVGSTIEGSNWQKFCDAIDLQISITDREM